MDSLKKRNDFLVKDNKELLEKLTSEKTQRVSLDRALCEKEELFEEQQETFDKLLRQKNKEMKSSDEKASVLASEKDDLEKKLAEVEANYEEDVK